MNRLGKLSQKIILALAAGIVMGLVKNPNKQIKIAKELTKEWEKIDRKSLNETIKRLYESKIVSYKDLGGGNLELILTEKGRRVALRYNLDTIKIIEPLKWDKLWRMVIFDIPETNRIGRNALTEKLYQLGFKAIQKSVYVYPYECKKEIDFIIEVFGLRRYVRYITIKNIDIDLDLRKRFGLKVKT